MKSFLNWLEDAVAAPTATTVSGSPGATTSDAIAPYLQPVGIGSVIKRQFPGEHRRHRRHKKHKR
jgi:hypothetical protein